jgi:hypothetical protein
MNAPREPWLQIAHDPWLDDDTADRMLLGLLEPGDAPPGYAPVVLLVRALRAPADARELAAEHDAVAVASAILRSRTAEIAPPRRVTAIARRRLARSARSKAVALVLAAALLATGGLATAGSLPDPAQAVVEKLLSTVGIDVPGPSDEAPGTGDREEGAAEVGDASGKGRRISEIATSTDAEGRDKGAEISGEASGGKSRAGEDREPEGKGRAEETGRPGGTGRPGERDASHDASPSDEHGRSEGKGHSGEQGKPERKGSSGGPGRSQHGAGSSAGTVRGRPGDGA